MKRSLKKITALGMAAAMAFSLAGCGSNNGGGETTTAGSSQAACGYKYENQVPTHIGQALLPRPRLDSPATLHTFPP